MTTVGISELRDSHVKSVAEGDILKSPNDTDRQYRGVTLKNGLKILLVSDHTAQTSAASMSVGIGSASDPKDVQGIAHFLEHMLFLGTEKYPEENDYSKFITTHGGETNASTDREYTSYYFSIKSEELMPALDRFCSFFVCPLFTESSTQRELNAIQSEFERTLKSDLWRNFTLTYSLTDQKHPLNTFSAGNMKSLSEQPLSCGIDVRQRLFEFYRTHYSSSIMCLSVLGKESLDELEAAIVPMFSNVPTVETAKRLSFVNPFSNLQKKEVHIVPVNDTRHLEIVFNIPYMLPYYRSGPDHYVSNLIGHEGSGSLLKALQSKGWAVELVSGSNGCRGFDLFSVTVTLYQAGLENIYGVVEMLFQYIAMLRAVGPQKWFFDEVAIMAEMFFRYKEKDRESTVTSQLSRLLHLLPVEHVLKFGSILDMYDETLINELMTHLTPDNVRLVLAAKDVEGLMPNVPLSEEKWYGTKYRLMDIPEDILNRWRNVKPAECFHMPPKNEFIPRDISAPSRDSLCAPAVKDSNVVPGSDPHLPSVPSLVYDSAFTKLWFKLDDTFFVPKATISAKITLPILSWHPLYGNLALLFLNLFQLHNQELNYAATLGGMMQGADVMYLGLEMVAKGFSENLLLLVTRVIKSLEEFVPSDRKQFDDLKDVYTRNVHNALLGQSYKQAGWSLDQVLLSQIFSYQEQLQFISDCTFERLLEFIPRLLGSIHFEFLVHGDIELSDALSTVRTVEDLFKERRKSLSLLPAELAWRRRSVSLPAKSYNIFAFKSLVQPTHALTTFFQTGVQSIRSSTMIDLYCQICADPVFDFVRTKKQLGYIVFMSPKRIHGSEGIQLTVQSSYPINVLDHAFEEFIKTIEELLGSMSEEEFLRFKEGLETYLSEKPKKLSSEAYRHWREIISGQYNFKRSDQCIAELRSFTIDDLKTFHSTFIAVDGPERRKLSICIYPASHASTAEESVESSGSETGYAAHFDPWQAPERPDVDVSSLYDTGVAPTVVGDISDFKSHLPLYPIFKPVIPTSLPKSNL